MPPRKQNRGKGNTKIGEGGKARRAYGVFKEKRTEINAPWSVDALDSLLGGDPTRLKGALKVHKNVDVDERLRLVADYEPAIGETVEMLHERIRTEVVKDHEDEAKGKLALPALGDDGGAAAAGDGTPSLKKPRTTPNRGDLFGAPEPPKEWTSVSFAPPVPKKSVHLRRAKVRTWVKHGVVAVSVDKSTFTLRDTYTEKEVHRVPRAKVRPLGSEKTLLSEPHVCFGSLKDVGPEENAMISAKTYFKSLRLGDEATDGGGVYGRSISLGHALEQHKMLATVGDTLIHLVMKNKHLKNRTELLGILMSINSFSMASLMVTNASNRTAIDEMDPPFYFRVPVMSYTYNLQVQLRALKVSLGQAIAKKTSPFLTPIVHQLQGVPEQSDPSLLRWNNGRRGNGTVAATSGTLVHVAPKHDSAVNASAIANGTLNDPLLLAASEKTSPTKGSLTPTRAAPTTEAATAAGASESSSSSSSASSAVRVPFVDSGIWRGVVIGHRIIAPLPSWGLSSADEDASEDTMARGMEVCVEWDPSSNPKQSKGEGFRSSSHQHNEAGNQAAEEVKTPTPTSRGAPRRGDDDDDEAKQRRKPKKKPVRKTHAMMRAEAKAKRKQEAADKIAAEKYAKERAEALSKGHGWNGLSRRKWYRASSFRDAHPVVWRAYLTACGPISAREGLLPGNPPVMPPPLPMGLRKKTQPNPLSSTAGGGGAGGRVSGALAMKAAATANSTAAAPAGVGGGAVVVIGPVTLANLRTPPLAGGQPWPTDTIAHAATLTPSQQSPNVMDDGFVLRPVEERAFVKDLAYDVFTPVALTDMSGAKGGAKSLQAKAAADKWFRAELEQLRASLRDMDSYNDEVYGEGSSQWSQSQSQESSTRLF